MSIPGTVRVLTEPAAEPITLAQAKEWCRVDSADEDALLTMLIQAMREYAEDLTGRAFVQRTLELRLDAFPCGPIQIPCPPLVSVDYLQYVDSDGTVQSLDGSPNEYRYWTQREPGLLAPVWNGVWPATRSEPEAVRVGFTAGYALGVGSPTDYTANIPAKLKLWMRARISTLNENRETLIMNNQIQIPRDLYDGLLDGLIVGSRLF